MVQPDFVGHGIGSLFHAPPLIFHTHNAYPGDMQPGMTFTIEPIIVEGQATENCSIAFFFVKKKKTRSIRLRYCAARVPAVARRVDGGDPRPVPFGSVRAHSAHHLLGRRHTDRRASFFFTSTVATCNRCQNQLYSVVCIFFFF